MNLQATSCMTAEPEMAESATAPDVTTGLRLAGKRIGMAMFSSYPADPRPRRAIDALRKEGAAIDLICVGDGAAAGDGMPALNVFRLPIEHNRGGFLSYAYEYSSFIFLASVILAWRSLRGRYDLIYVHNMPDVLVAVALIPKLFGAKVILDQHDPMPELMMTIFGRDEESRAVKLLRRLEKWSIARADKVITVSDTFKRIFAGRSCPASKISVVMNTPDEGIFRYRSAHSYAVRKPEDRFVMMYHGLLESRNGLHVAIDAFKLLRERIPNAEMRIYGRGTPYLQQMLDKATQMGVGESVHYFGPKTLEQLAVEIQKCDVGVIPNPRNRFTGINTPTRIFEYLALGKPVIAARTQGVEEYFDADSLVYFEPGDAADLAMKLEYVAIHGEDAAAIAERGQMVYRFHAWSREREVLVQTVAELVH